MTTPEIAQEVKERIAKTIDIPEGVELIGYGSFRGCCKLEQVTIPNSVKKFEDTAFVNCENLSWSSIFTT